MSRPTVAIERRDKVIISSAMFRYVMYRNARPGTENYYDNQVSLRDFSSTQWSLKKLYLQLRARCGPIEANNAAQAEWGHHMVDLVHKVESCLKEHISMQKEIRKAYGGDGEYLNKLFSARGCGLDFSTLGHGFGWGGGYW